MTDTLILVVISRASRTYMRNAHGFGLCSTISYGMGKPSSTQMGFKEMSYAIVRADT